jgi:hypothetical protein
MCPLCIAAAAQMAVAATSTGGMIAIVVRKLRTKIRANGIPGRHQRRINDEKSNRTSENRVTR